MAQSSTDSEAGTYSKRTPLFDLHREFGGKMVPFAGYEMPVQYSEGILKEHQHTRANAGLFDVSHMGQVELLGEGAAVHLEALMPGDICGLAENATRYTQFTNDCGGILDDLMVTNAGDRLLLVVNAACRAADIQHLRDGLPDSIEVHELPDRALLALQGPKAANILTDLGEAALSSMPFMSVAECEISGVACRVWRSGYTGEDGYEISCAADAADGLARTLFAHADVSPIGLGARDSLRLEAGLCLYGHDIDTTTTPIEAGLLWSIGKRRREEGGFPGADIVQKQIANGPPRRRVGLRPAGRAPIREHTKIFDVDGAENGVVTSGGFGPSVGSPVAMGYVETRSAKTGTQVEAVVRGKRLEAEVCKLPFVQQNYYRG